MHVATGVVELAGKLNGGYRIRLNADLLGRSVCSATPMGGVVVKRVAGGNYDATWLKGGVTWRAVPGNSQIYGWKSRPHTELLIRIYGSRVCFVIAPNFVITDIRVGQKAKVDPQTVLT
jgi:hypothetical protein